MSRFGYQYILKNLLLLAKIVRLLCGYWLVFWLFLSIMTFGLVRLSILVEMLVFGYLKNSRFRFGLRLCRLADHSLNVTFPSHCLSSPFFKMELPSTKFRK